MWGYYARVLDGSIEKIPSGAIDGRNLNHWDEIIDD